MTRTSIEWVRNPGDGSQGFTVNPIRFRNKETGKVGHYCEKCSPGCKNCYASRIQKGPYLSGLEFTAENKDRGELFFHEHVLQQVLRRRKPSTFFWCDCTDMFGSWVPDDWIDRCAAVCALTHQHRHLWLTKRAKRMKEYFGLTGRDEIERAVQIKTVALSYGAKLIEAADWMPWPYRNLGIGVSAEDQERADERCEDLKATPAAMRFVSIEPLLGAVNARLATSCNRGCNEFQYAECPGTSGPCVMQRQLDWVIVGGESGPGARPMHPDWVRSVRDQCQAAGVPFFFKQWGEWLPDNQNSAMNQEDRVIAGQSQAIRVGKRAAGRLLDGKVWDEMPEMLRV